MVGGCATHAQRLAAPRDAFYTNDLQQAHFALDKLAERPKGDASVVELDLAMVELMQGDPASAEGRLREIRDLWDHLEQKSVAEEAAALLTDDSRRAYSGEDYEKLLLRVFLTLSSLMQDGMDAEPYALQTLFKQQDLAELANSRWGARADSYCVPPIAPYLRGVLREASLKNYDDALHAYQATEQLLPGVSHLATDIARVEHGVHSAPENGVVYVFAMVGRGPYKIEVAEQATQEALLIADRILSAVGDHSLPPTLAPVKIPQLVSPSKPFDVVGVEVNGVPVATTFTITDVHQLASDSYAAKLPEVMARTVARRVVKKGAIYAAKDQLNLGPSWTSLAMDAAGVAWEATEAADTRCWGVLPREIQLLRLELPAGRHEIRLEPVTAGRPIAPGRSSVVEVRDGRNSYVLSYWPDHFTIGQVLVSR